MLGDIRTKNFEDLQTHLVMLKDNVSEEMKTAFETLIEHIEYANNALKYTYSNGYTEGLNNYIKTIKKVAFGYKSFFHFRNRILISFKLKQQFKITMELDSTLTPLKCYSNSLPTLFDKEPIFSNLIFFQVH
ncbi:transposase [Helcococcus kunzii]|nr:transposase [Helcococcus kunzii]MCT1988626.1 transposase [Helcococcus kunzii]